MSLEEWVYLPGLLQRAHSGGSLRQPCVHTIAVDLLLAAGHCQTPVVKQVVLSGGRLQPGTTKPEEGTDRQQWSIMNQPATQDAILPHVLFIQKILRRRPFMIKALENVMRRWLQSLVRLRAAWPVIFLQYLANANVRLGAVVGS